MSANYCLMMAINIPRVRKESRSISGVRMCACVLSAIFFCVCVGVGVCVCVCGGENDSKEVPVKPIV